MIKLSDRTFYLLQPGRHLPQACMHLEMSLLSFKKRVCFFCSTQLLPCSVALLIKAWHCKGYLCVQETIAEPMFVSDSRKWLLFCQLILLLLLGSLLYSLLYLVLCRPRCTAYMSFPAELRVHQSAMCGMSLSCFNPSRQLSPTQPLTQPPQWDGEENRKGKSEKTRGLR